MAIFLKKIIFTLFFGVFLKGISLNIDLLIFDADDTLWESAAYFENTEAAFLDLMENLGHNRKNIMHLIHQRDMERLEHTGYGAGPYLETLKEILLEFDYPADSSAEKTMESIARELLSHPVILFDDVRNTVSELHDMGFYMVVYTMGEKDHQLSKYKKSGLGSFFRECFVVSRKTPESIEYLLRETGFTPENAAVIGNSPRSDINPALKAGITNIVYISRPDTWIAEHEEFTNPERVYVIENLKEVIPFLRTRNGIQQENSVRRS